MTTCDRCGIVAPVEWWNDGATGRNLCEECARSESEQVHGLSDADKLSLAMAAHDFAWTHLGCVHAACLAGDPCDHEKGAELERARDLWRHAGYELIAALHAALE